MDDILLVTENGKNQTSKRSRERSRNHPGISLDRGIEFLLEVKEKMGSKPFTRNSLASAFNVIASSGGFSVKLGALYQFGLLDSRADGLVVSDIGKRILLPLSEEDKRRAIREAFMKPELYLQLLKDFGGDKLPKELANRLHYEYEISETARENAVRCFIESARFSGFLDDNQVLTSAIETPQSITTGNNRSLVPATDAIFTEETEESPSSRVSTPTADKNDQSIILAVTGGKKVHLILPMGLTQADIRILKAQLDVLSLQIELNQDLDKMVE